MFNISLHLFPRPISALLTARIKWTIKPATFRTEIMAVINQSTYPPVAFEALATSVVSSWQWCGGWGGPRWWKGGGGGSRTRRSSGGRIRGGHKPRILQWKSHNCIEYTEHCIKGTWKFLSNSRACPPSAFLPADTTITRRVAATTEVASSVVHRKEYCFRGIKNNNILPAPSNWQESLYRHSRKSPATDKLALVPRGADLHLISREKKALWVMHPTTSNRPPRTACQTGQGHFFRGEQLIKTGHEGRNNKIKTNFVITSRYR